MAEKIAVLTSGGDAPGMNAAIRAVVRSALYYGMQPFGVERGYKGLTEGDIFPMTRGSVSDIISKGGTILKTARLPEFTEREVRKKAADNLESRGIKGLVVIGGDGSFRGAKALSGDFGINVIGLPGTIDNDLAYTDYTIGFDTAVNTALWAINNLRDTMTSHDRVCIVEVMGRTVGDIALYSAVSGGADDIIVPESPYRIEDVCRDIEDNARKGKSSDIIILAEGAGKAEEVKSEIKAHCSASVRTMVLGHIQRGGSPTARDRILAARTGVRAVELIREGATNRLVGVRGEGIYDIDIEEALSMKKSFDAELYKTAKIISF